MIEVRPTPDGNYVDEVVATNATVHMEVLGDQDLMLIIDDGERHVHVQVFHSGSVPLHARVYEDQAVTA